jgi:small neutral amino acid transporter SnatA (MarC family)
MNTYFQIAFEFSLVLVITINPMAWLALVAERSESISRTQRKALSMILWVAIAVILLFSFLFGRAVLHLLGLNPSWLDTTINSGWMEVFLGGLFIYFAFRSLTSGSPHAGNHDDQINRKFVIWPLAFPMLAGPSAIAASLYYSTIVKTAWEGVMMCSVILAVAGLCAYLMFCAVPIGNRLGHRGLTIYRWVSSGAIGFIALMLIWRGMNKFSW